MRVEFLERSSDTIATGDSVDYPYCWRSAVDDQRAASGPVRQSAAL